MTSVIVCGVAGPHAAAARPPELNAAELLHSEAAWWQALAVVRAEHTPAAESLAVLGETLKRLEALAETASARQPGRTAQLSRDFSGDRAESGPLKVKGLTTFSQEPDLVGSVMPMGQRLGRQKPITRNYCHGATGKLALTVSGSFLAGEPFSVTAYVKGPVPRQTLTLDLPEGLACVEGKHTETVAPPAAGSRDTSVLTWKIKAARAGQYAIKVRSSTGIAQTQPVSIREHAVASGGHLAGLTVTGPLVQGQVLMVTATVNSPLPGQHLTLTLPTGLERTAGELRQTVPAGRTHGECAVAWKVKAQQAGKFTLAVQSSTGGTVSKHIAIALAKQAEFTILDARRALQMSVGNLPENLVLDMDRDGRVTSMDAAIILQRVLDRTRKGK